MNEYWHAADGWTWLALAALPFWIGAFSMFAGWLIELPSRYGRLGFAIYMGVGVTSALFAAIVPASMAMRYLERAHRYESCVIHRNALDRLNGCPEWTVRAVQELPR